MTETLSSNSSVSNDRYIPKMVSVSIVILNYNGEKIIGECLKAVFDQDYEDYRVYFADNASTDNSVKFVKKHFPKAIIKVAEKNKGVSGGTDFAIRSAETDLVGFVSNDVIISKSWLREMVDTMEKYPKAGIIGGLNYFYGSDRIFSSVCTRFVDLRYKNRTIGYNLTPKQVRLPKKPVRMDIANGCCYMVRKQAFMEAGGFDKKFFCYYDDDDFSYKVKKKGYEILFQHKAVAHHKDAVTLKKFTYSLGYHCFRNRITVGRRHYDPLSNIILYFYELPLHFFYNLSAAIRKNDFEVMKGTFKGISDGLSGRLK
ncbi:glycosyltransferase [Candidatus Woesearchaeota archaeon]|nr:glycosyltransferase [Candidatus Woesearchaeota archaeon]